MSLNKLFNYNHYKWLLDYKMIYVCTEIVISCQDNKILMLEHI